MRGCGVVFDSGFVTDRGIDRCAANPPAGIPPCLGVGACLMGCVLVWMVWRSAPVLHLSARRLACARERALPSAGRPLVKRAHHP